jgi:serine/threonine-protein kinase HipA
MSVLEVFMHDRRAGILERRAQARLEFRYTSEILGAGGPPLSLSLPLRPQPFDHRECEPFFAGLLPEGEFRKAIAQAFHVSTDNAFGLLAAVGGECAGAVSLARPGEPPPGLKAPAPHWLDEPTLAALLDSLPRRPLLVAADEELGLGGPGDAEEDGGIRLSLAGTNDKLGVLMEGERIAISRGSPPTTHILKIPVPGVPEIIANEAFCMALATAAGLEAAPVQARSSGEREYLLVRRYDRTRGPAGDGRLHQEDLCQALGYVPALKYEAEGGPGIEPCAELLRRASSAPARDVIAFLDALLFNFLIGNHDAHSKNYSLLLEGPGAVRLAPLYDLLATAVYHGLSRKLAMRYGGEYRPQYLRGRHLERLATQLAVRGSLVRQRALAVTEATLAGTDAARAQLPARFADAQVIDAIQALLSERAERLRATVGEM